MSYLILIRHGQSTWNLENRFTGWVDVDLTENGKLEAKKAGDLIQRLNININYFYSSFQIRANHTLKIIQKSLNSKKNFIRAETVSFEDFEKYGGAEKAKENGKLRVEGKDYLVRDGDVLFFRVNV